MIKVLLDTDIGTDVDDAVALAYLLAQPECELLGITTVTGEAEERAALASVICTAAGKDIPIYPGAEMPLVIPQGQPRAQQAAALPHWRHRSDFPRGQAIEFLAETIRTYPGQVVLCTIGPLTNIGLLFQRHPEIPELLKELVTMGGVYTGPGAAEGKTEWNTGGDPQATEIVFRTPVRRHRALGLDVTQQVLLTEEQVRQKFTAPLLRPVLDFAKIWFAGFYPSITFHDPLTAAVIFKESLCTFERGTVTIDMEERPGRTLWLTGGESAPHEIAVSVAVERYFEHFFGVMEKDSPQRSEER